MHINRKNDSGDLLNEALLQAIRLFLPLAVDDDATLILLEELEGRLIRRLGSRGYTDLLFAAQHDADGTDDWLADHRCSSTAIC